MVLIFSNCRAPIYSDSQSRYSMSHGSYKHKGLVDCFCHVLCACCSSRFIIKRWWHYLPECLFVSVSIGSSLGAKLLLISFSDLVGLSFFDSSRRCETKIYWFDKLYTLENYGEATTIHLNNRLQNPNFLSNKHGVRDSFSQRILNIYTLFFVSNSFISNTRLKLTENTQKLSNTLRLKFWLEEN